MAKTRAPVARPGEIETREQKLAAVSEEHGARLLSLINRKIRDRAEAEDVYQDVMEEFIETYDLGQAIDSLGAWLVKVAQNKIVDRFRRKKTRDDSRDEVIDAENDRPISRPDDEWMRTWLREEMLAAIELLPDDQREVFVMHELEGKSFEEIAIETGVAVNTLLSKKRYAILFLREHLQEIYDELE